MRRFQALTRSTIAVAALTALTAILPAETRAQAGTLAPRMPDAAVLSELRLRSIGPAAMSGRISDIAVATIPGETPGRVIYAATAAGGVWKSTNGGITWMPIFADQPVASIGDVTVAPSNPDIIWVGSGESNNLRSSSWGNGIYKSIDAGETWTFVGLPTSQHVPRILVHPTNPDIVYVAAMGPLWMSGGERGVYKTTDGGRTWNRVLETGPNTGATDLVFDPANPEVIYAATMQRERKAYSFVAGGSESGIHKSTDGGATWTRLMNGLPAGESGRIGIDVSLTQPRTVYAYIDAAEGGVFRSEDGGATWTRQNPISSLPWFTGQVRADTGDPDRVYHIGQTLSVSTDGGSSWQRIAGSTHADHHAMWINPTNPDHVIIGNDGGLFISHDGAETWDFASNLPVSTFYAIAVDMHEPFYRVFGGLQDNGTWGAPVATRTRAGITNDLWYRAGGGDGFYAAIDPTDPSVVYSESQNGALNRFDQKTGESKSIRPSGDDVQLRFNWSAPLLISPHDHNTLYFGANYLFKSTDRGDTWTRLGDDLTRNLDRDTLPIMGLRAAGGYRRHDGTAEFGNLATIDESTITAGLLWVGSDDGVIQVSRDGGGTWRRIDQFPGVPALTYVSRIEASHHDAGTVYATFDGHRDNDFRPYVMKSTDFGSTWTSISSNLPEQGSLQVIREHPRNRDVLFVGSEFGLFASVNGGRSWATMRPAGFPTVAVHDIVIHPRENDLVIGTHGRGIWVLDDITPIEQLASAVAGNQARLFPVRPAIAFNLDNGAETPGDRNFSGENRPAGALITWSVNSALQGRTTLAILDASGATVRELEADGQPGLHRVEWDLHWGPPDAPGAPPAAGPGGGRVGFGGFGGANRGPFAAAGQYGVELRVGAGASAIVAARTMVEVRRDPLVSLTAAQWSDLDEWRSRAYRVQVEANALVQQLEEARGAAGADTDRIDAIITALRGQQGGRGGVGGRGGAFGGRGGNNSVVGQVSGTANSIGNSHFPVTVEQRREIGAAERGLAQQRQAAQSVLGGGDRQGRLTEDAGLRRTFHAGDTAWRRSRIRTVVHRWFSTTRYVSTASTWCWSIRACGQHDLRVKPAHHLPAIRRLDPAGKHDRVIACEPQADAAGCRT